MTMGGIPAGKGKIFVLTEKGYEGSRGIKRGTAIPGRNTPDTVKQSGSGRVHWQIKPRRIVKFEDRAVPADRQVFESPQDTGRNITAENGRQAGTSGCDIFQL